MQFTKRFWLANLVLVGAAYAMLSFHSRPTAAQDTAGKAAGTQEIGAALRKALVTQVITLNVEGHRGEPRNTTGKAKFDRNIECYWISVVGSDVKFTYSTEKQINRQLFSVDPFGKVVNGREIEVTGKLGLRDGSGNWDDSYEGTITVAVTAVLSD